jgi:hypothetical protein
LARRPERDKLIKVVPANAEKQIVEAVRAVLSLPQPNVGERTIQPMIELKVDETAERQI